MASSVDTGSAPEAVEVEPAARPPRLRKRERTRLQIQRAAAQLFKTKPYEDVTIAEIAEAANIDSSTFWRHFTSKSALLLADLELSLQQFRDELEAHPDGGVAAVIRALASAYAAIDFEFAALRNSIAANADADLKAARLAARDELMKMVSAALAERLGADPWTDPRPYVLANTLVGAMGWLRSHPRQPLETDLDGRVEAIHEALTQAARTVLDL